jgi:cytidine deaminase
VNSTLSDDALLRMALTSMESAHAPYSGVTVGAIALGKDGQVYPGCNIENASLGLTVCAERVALWNALAHGTREIATLVLTSNNSRVNSPCGACRQVMLELAPDARILFGDESGVTREWGSPRELLPDAFESGWKT